MNGLTGGKPFTMLQKKSYGYLKQFIFIWQETLKKEEKKLLSGEILYVEKKERLDNNKIVHQSDVGAM